MSADLSIKRRAALYRRWLPFAALTSHTRCHGAPPREPWDYDDAFVDDFRRADRTQISTDALCLRTGKGLHLPTATRCCGRCFSNFPTIPQRGSSTISICSAPICWLRRCFRKPTTASVYLPPGKWIDYQTGKAYDGGHWHDITAGKIPIVLLVKDGSVIPHVATAQCTADIDWKHVELRVFCTSGQLHPALFSLPEGELQTLRVTPKGDGYELASDPLAGQVHWQIQNAAAKGTN